VERLARFQIGRRVLRGSGPGHVKPLSRREIGLLFGEKE